MELQEGYIQITQEEYNGLKEEICKLKEDVLVLSEKLAKLSKTSINSSKPPSSDLVKPQHKNNGEKKGKTIL